MATARLRFPIALDIAGERMTFIGCDMRVGWFFQGFPDPMPLTACWRQEDSARQRQLVEVMDAWQDQLLCRGVWLVDDRAGVCRRFTPELVQRLGDQRDRAIALYMSGIGWIRPQDTGYEVSAAPLPRPLPTLDDPFADVERRAAMTRIPSKNVLLGITQVAKRAGVATHAIWRRWWISEFLWTWHSYQTDGTASREEHGLTDDFAHIGIEA